MNTLIVVKNGMSICVCNGSDYPVIDVTSSDAIIACTTSASAKNIAIRTGGHKVDTPRSEYPFEVRISIDKFSKVLKFNSWYDIVKDISSN